MINRQEFQQEANEAFDKAVNQDRLSRSQEADNFVGKYMFMGNYNGKDNFKNIITRSYNV